MGGQSAFGTKAGDLFTRITIIVAAIWVLLSLASVKFLNLEGSRGGLNASERGNVTLPMPKTDTKAAADKAGETPAPKGDTGTSTPEADSSSTAPAAPAEKSAAPATPSPAEAPGSTTDNAKP
jgi:preprotein translocase subunit SecG